MKRALAVVALALLALPAPASAASYRGKTSQGLKVSAWVKDGRLKLLKIQWRASCEHNDPWTSGTRWDDTPQGPIEHEGSRFTDSGTVEHEFTDGRGTSKQKLSGEILKGRITGKMTLRMKFYDRSGEHADSCRGTFRFDIPKV